MSVFYWVLKRSGCLEECRKPPCILFCLETYLRYEKNNAKDTCQTGSIVKTVG